MARFATDVEIQFDLDRLLLPGGIDVAEFDFILFSSRSFEAELFGDFDFGFFGDIDGQLDDYFLFDISGFGRADLLISVRDIDIDVDRFFDAIDSSSTTDDYAVLFGRADQIELSTGDDRINGFAGSDRIFGDLGRDTLIGGAGRDTLDGGIGDDRLIGSAGGDRLIGGRGDDTLIGGGDADQLVGGEGRDLLNGGGGGDRLVGQGGDDQLRGGGGDDRLFGQAGDDVIRGAGGVDRINGGAGDDRLFGGSGRDIFIFAPSGGSDQIRDFRDGVDRIRISAANELDDLDIAQTGGAVTITFRGLEIRVVGADADDFTAADFLF